MNLSKEAIERINSEAKAFGENQSKHFIPLDSNAQAFGYRFGAKKEAERAKQLVNALKTIRKDVKGEPNLLDIIDNTLNEYNTEIKKHDSKGTNRASR